jgi:hypothetical protein
MNDFPIPEDPPVTMTAEKVLERFAWRGHEIELGQFSPGRRFSAGLWFNPNINPET